MLTREEFDKLPKEQQDALIKKMSEIQDIQKGIVKDEESGKKLSMEELKGMVENTAKEYIKNMTAVDKKFFMFPGIGNPDNRDDKSPEGKFSKMRMFLRALVGGETSVLNAMHAEAIKGKALSEGTTTAGGFIVPEEFKAEVLRLMPQYGVLRRECRIIPMAYDILNIPAAGTSDQSANWTNEAAQILQTDPNFRQVVLTINKLACLPAVTNELLADANVDTIQYLAELISEAFAKAEDIQGFTGTGSPFVGVLTATGAPTYPHIAGTAFITLSYQDLVDIPAQIYDNALGNAKFFFHRSMMAHIRGLITTAGAPIIGATAKEVAGYPLISTEVLPGKNHANAKTDATPYAVFGDLRRGVAMGERGTISMKISDQATVASTNLFEKDMVALRMIERVAIGILLPSSFVSILS